MDEETSIDISQFFAVLSKRKSIIITITLVAVLISAILSFFIMTPVYESTVTVIIGNKNDTSSQSTVQYDQVMMYQNLTKTYSEIATSKYIEQKALDALGNGMPIDKFNKLITVTTETNTQLLTITAQANTAQDALNEVTALSEAFAANAKNVYAAGDAKILDKGELPSKPVKPNKVLNVTIAFALGLMISTGLAFLLEYMDSTMKTADDIKKYLELPVLGTIPMQTEQEE